MAKLFLSHSSKDNADAVAISEWLRANGWDDIFLDFDPQRGIKGGDRWEQALNEAASRCEAVVFLVSRAWLASDWCLKEFGLAAKLNKRLLGVLIEDVPVTDLPVFLTDTWQMIDLARGLRREAFTIALPVTGESAEVSFSSEGLVRLREGLRKAGLDPNFFAWPPANDPGRSPYPGLRPLEADDAGVFFGREVQIIEALDRLRAVRDGSVAPLLCVLGASGSGKSSFLRAGILPRLKRDDRMFLPLPVLRPGRSATSGGTGLASVLVSAFALAGLALARRDAEAAIREGAAGLRPLFDRLVETAARSGDDGGATPPLLVLSIDQAEELFLADGADESAALLQIVADLASQARRQLAILLTIRSESFERLQTAPQWEGVTLATLTFSPMPKGLYATLIERPAARLADTDRPLAVEPALVRALLDDMADGGGRDALPLLAFTLERIWLEFGASGRLTLQNYEALGRVRGSIEAAVERAIAAADADPRIPKDRSARLMLLRRGLVPWLAGIDPDTGSPRRRVARRAEIPDEALPLVDLLIEQRLLASDVDPVTGETVIEPAHEALLRQWGLLDGWLIEDFALLATLEGVKRATREWEANAREPAWLAHQGGRLADAQGLDARTDIATMLAAADRAYLSACLAQETAEREALEQRRVEREAEQTRRLIDARKIARRTGIGLVVALVLAATAGIFGFVAKQQKSRADEKTVEAQTQTAQAERSRKAAEAEKRRADISAEEARRSADVAQKRLREGQFSESKSLAERSLEKDAAGDTTSAVELALKALPANYADPERPILARAEYALKKAVWDHRIKIKATLGRDRINDATLSPDGSRIAVSGRDGGLHLVDSRSGADVWAADVHRLAAFMSRFSADGKRIATSYQQPPSIIVRDVATGTVISDFTVETLLGQLGTISFLSSGRIAYSGGAGDTFVRIYDSTTGRSVSQWPFTREFASYTKSIGELDGGERIFATSDGDVQIWDVASGRTFFASGKTGNEETDKAVQLEAQGTQLERLSEVRDLEPGKRFLGRSGSTIYVVSETNRKVERSWVYADAGSNGRFIDAFLVARLNRYDNKRAVILPRTNTELGVFDIASGMLLRTLAGHTANLVTADVSNNGQLVAASAEDGTIRVWERESGRQLYLFKLTDTPISRVAFTSDNESLLAQAASSIYMLDVNRPEVRGRLGRLGPGWQVKAIDPSGATAVAISGDLYHKRVSLIDLIGTQPVVPLPLPEILDVKDKDTVFSADGKQLAMLVAINGFNPKDASRAALTTLTSKTNPSLSRDVEAGNITTAGAIVSIPEGRISMMLPARAHQGMGRPYNSFSPDGRYFCQISGNNFEQTVSHVSIVEISTGREVVSAEQKGKTGTCLFSEKTLLAVTQGETSSFRRTTTISGWDPASGFRRFMTEGIPTDRKTKVSFIAGGRQILVANEEHPPVLLMSDTGRPLNDFGQDMIGAKGAEMIGPDRVKIERKDDSWAVWDLTSQTKVPNLSGTEINFKINDWRILRSGSKGSLVLLRLDRVDKSVFRVIDIESGAILLETDPISQNLKAPLLDQVERVLVVPASETTITVYDFKQQSSVRHVELGTGYNDLVLCGGDLLLSKAKNGNLKSWDLATGQQREEWPALNVERQIRVPSQRSDLVGLLDAGAGARVVNIRTGETVWRSETANVRNMVFSSDGAQIAVVFSNEVVVFELTTKRRLASHTLATDDYQFADIAPDGIHVAISSRAGAVLLIDLASGKKLAAFAVALRFQWAPRGATFAFVRGNTIEMADASAGGRARSVEATANVAQYAFDPTGQSLIIGCEDGTIGIADVATATLQPIIRLGKPPRWLAFAGSTSKVLVHESTGVLGLWQVEKPKVLTVFQQAWSGNEVSGWKAKIDDAGSILAVVYPDNRVKAFDIGSGKSLSSLTSDTPFDDILPLEGSTIATLKDDGFVERFDARTNKLLPSLRVSAEKHGFKSLQATSTPVFMVIAQDGTVAFVSPVQNNAVLIREAVAQSFNEKQIMVNADITSMVAVDPGGDIRIWDVTAKALVARWTADVGSKDSLNARLSLDGRAMILRDDYSDVGFVTLPFQRQSLLQSAHQLVPTPDRPTAAESPTAPRLGITMRPISKGIMSR